MMILRYGTIAEDLQLLLSIPCCFVDCLNNPLSSSNVIAARGVGRQCSETSERDFRGGALLGFKGCKSGASLQSNLAICRLSEVAVRRSRSTTPSICGLRRALPMAL